MTARGSRGREVRRLRDQLAVLRAQLMARILQVMVTRSRDFCQDTRGQDGKGDKSTREGGNTGPV